MAVPAAVVGSECNLHDVVDPTIGPDVREERPTPGGGLPIRSMGVQHLTVLHRPIY